MSILGPISLSLFAWIAGGAAVLAISAYIIKMRRRRFEVPFSRLWQRVLEQREANALWKQLRRLLSLLLILFIIGIMLFAALDPTLGAVDRKARSVVILFDASASMKAMDGDDKGEKSRLDAAKDKAKRLIDGMGGGDVAMIMKVDGQATPMSRFTNDGPMLDKIVDDIAASDTPADLTRALGAAADALRDRPNPLIVLVSDGAFPEPQLAQVDWAPGAAGAAASPGGTGSGAAATGAAGSGAAGGAAGSSAWSTRNLAAVDLSNVDVRYLPVGHRSDNVGIIAFNVRRYIANKAAYEVYIEVQNFGQEAAHRQLTLYNGDTAVDVRKLDLAPGQRVHQIYAKLPASVDDKLRASLRPVDGPGGSDPFALDDQAYALLPAKKKQKVLLVGSPNLFLEGALLVYENIDLIGRISAGEYDARPDVAEGADVVVFDDHTPDVMPPPPISLLFFHPSGKNSPIAVRREVANPHITEVDEGHPVMRWVTLTDVYMDKAESFSPDARKGESSLAFSVTDSVIAAKRDGKRKILAIGFSLPAQGRESATDLPMRVAFPMLLVNALDWFAGDQTDLLTTYPTGTRERVPLDGVVGATEAEVRGPDGRRTRTPVIDGLATFYGSRVGYYDLAAKAPDGTVLARVELAANLSSIEESDIAPSAKLTLGGARGKQLAEPEAFAVTRSRKLWIYLIVFAAGLLLVEWITYHRRITV
jgi:hypothetical protein